MEKNGTIERSSVKPDIPLPDAFDGIDYREKFSPAALPAETVTKNAWYKPLAALPISELKKGSEERVNRSPDFQQIKKLIDQLRAQQERTVTIPLKWDGFEKWAKQNRLTPDMIEGSSASNSKKFTVDNHSLDKALLVNNEYAREVNNKWLLDIGRGYLYTGGFFHFM